MKGEEKGEEGKGETLEVKEGQGEIIKVAP